MRWEACPQELFVQGPWTCSRISGEHVVSVQHPVTPAGSCSLRVPEARGTKENQLRGHGPACHQPLRAPHYTESITRCGGGGVLGST